MLEKQSTMFYVEEKARHPKRVIKTAYFDEKELINDVMFLHNDGNPFDVDPTYSVGRFWQGLPEPVHKFDLSPQLPDVRQADSRALPFDPGQVGSIMFDPPFLVAPYKEAANGGKIHGRFSSFKTVDELKDMYRLSILEFCRVLRNKGVFVIKCQDFVFSSKQYIVHNWVINEAEKTGFFTKDLFLLIRDSVMLDPRVKKQQHARKTHSYFIVFQKATPNKAMFVANRRGPGE